MKYNVFGLDFIIIFIPLKSGICGDLSAYNNLQTQNIFLLLFVAPIKILFFFCVGKDEDKVLRGNCLFAFLIFLVRTLFKKEE